MGRLISPDEQDHERRRAARERNSAVPTQRRARSMPARRRVWLPEPWQVHYGNDGWSFHRKATQSWVRHGALYGQEMIGGCRRHGPFRTEGELEQAFKRVVSGVHCGKPNCAGCFDLGINEQQEDLPL